MRFHSPSSCFGASAPSRRRFLVASVGAALSCAPAPYVVSAAALKGGASDRVAVAAIGVGGRGAEIARQAAQLGDLVACADVQLTHAESIAREQPGSCRAYRDYREVLDRPDVQAVTIGTPDHWHAKIAADALLAGKDVYCEKPLTLTISEGYALERLVDETGRVFQVGTQQRSEFNQVFLKAVAIARSGRLGRRLHAVCSVEQADAGGPFAATDAPTDLDWDFWLGPAPRVDFTPNRIGWNFRWWLEYSGGQVTDWGVHHADIALWALGGERTGVVEVAGAGNFPGLPHTVNVLELLNGLAPLRPYYNVARDFDCQLKLANGNTINLVSKPNELIISGEAGRIRVNRGGLTGKLVDAIQADPAQRDWLRGEVAALYRQMPIEGHMANFLHCVKTRQTPISDIVSHCHAVNGCHMANIAMLLKRPVRFDHDQRRFVGDEEADLFIERTRREPWTLA